MHATRKLNVIVATPIADWGAHSLVIIAFCPACSGGCVENSLSVHCASGVGFASKPAGKSATMLFASATVRGRPCASGVLLFSVTTVVN
jgi:hypothetical protein